jgi:glutathione S-transferase
MKQPDFDGQIALKGSPGSPYTRKMLAVLRYRRIPYRYLQTQIHAQYDLPAAKVALQPTFYWPGKNGELEAVVDSTPIIRELEAMYPGRAIVPSDPVMAFLDDLIEDYADEWLTKAMFHYRWHFDEDATQGGLMLPRWGSVTKQEAQISPMSDSIRDRQVNRLYVVGSNDTTAPVIEASYLRLLDILDAHIRNGPYVLGSRPSACDFGLYGQLTQLTHFDPTPMAICLERTPQVFAWVDVIADLSGEFAAEDGWFVRDALPETLFPLLHEIGRVYVPALLANSAAIETGAETVQTAIDGQEWTQSPYPYQARCLTWLRQAYARLDEEDRRDVDSIIDGTGVEKLFVKLAQSTS